MGSASSTHVGHAGTKSTPIGSSKRNAGTSAPKPILRRPSLRRTASGRRIIPSLTRRRSSRTLADSPSHPAGSLTTKLRRLTQWDESALLVEFNSYVEAPPLARSPSELALGGRHQRSRRNTTNSIFVTSTLSVPDRNALLRCVCTVLHRHVNSIGKKSGILSPSSKLLVFDDDFGEERSRWGDIEVPTLASILRFVQRVYLKAKMEPECIIITYLYIERVVQATKGKMLMTPKNWRPLVLSCMILSSKVWDDLSMWNVDFSMICPQYTLQRINQLELALLDVLEYSVRVSAVAYAKNYFQLRSLMIKLGIGERPIGMLDMETARRLEMLTDDYNHKHRHWQLLTSPEGCRPRSLTLGFPLSRVNPGFKRAPLSLEQVVQRSEEEHPEFSMAALIEAEMDKEDAAVV